MLNAVKRVLTETWDSHSGELQRQINIQVEVSALQGDFIKQVGGTKHFAVFLTIMAYSNVEGVAFPSQQKIADSVGMTRDTVRKIISDLLEVEIGGKYLISRSINSSGKYNNHVYEILTTPVKKTAKEVREFNNGRDILNLFCDVYREVFEVSYQPNYSRDCVLFRDKMLKVYTDEQIRAVVETGVRNYPKWANKDYPRPSVSMLCGWVGNKALAIWQEEQKEEQEIIDRMSIDADAQASLAMRDLFGEG